MRTLLTLMAVGTMLLTAGSVLAENHRSDPGKMAVHELQDQILRERGHATLRLSPMYMEIHQINEAATRTEADILAEVAAATDDDQVMRLVHRLERLDKNRQLDVLKVRIRYARLAGRYERVFELQQEMLQMLQRDVASLM